MSKHRADMQKLYDAAVRILDLKNEIDRSDAEMIATELKEWYGAVLAEPDMTFDEAKSITDKIIADSESERPLTGFEIEAMCDVDD